MIITFFILIYILNLSFFKKKNFLLKNFYVNKYKAKYNIKNIIIKVLIILSKK